MTDRNEYLPVPLGRTVATPGALAALEQAGESPTTYLDRHAAGDWGDVGTEDYQENELSLDKELRLFSVYHTRCGDTLWVITEADRSATTILMPAEY